MQDQIVNLTKKLDNKENELSNLKNIIQKLQRKTASIGIEEEQDIHPDVLKLESQGYPLRSLLTIKKNIHSSSLRRRLKSIIKKYSSHESAKPQRMRMKILQEIISSEKIYVQSLKKVMSIYYHPILLESKKK